MNHYATKDPIKASFRKYGKGIPKGRSGKLPSKEEQMARALSSPANFGRIVLGYDLTPKQEAALDMCREPGMYGIACCNGGGKTSVIIPSLVLWHQSLWPAGKSKVTSGAYLQIEDQVWPAIMRHKEKFPNFKWLETPFFKSVDPETRTEGFFRGFTTNEPGRAEGDHEELPNRPLLFIVDEAKTSAAWLKGVLVGRVRPTRLILMSSHGFAEGWFYDVMRMSGAEEVKVRMVK